MTDEPRPDIAEMMLSLHEAMAPIFEAAVGVRSTVLNQGASVETAEEIYKHFVILMMTKALS